MIGQTLGHYRVLEQIGAGGMGLVFRARDERLDREVALKVLPPGTLTDENVRQRFRKEALTLSKLNHPNIATVFDFDTQDGVDFLVMELISGVTLDEKLKGGALSEKEVIRLAMQLADGLGAAHAEGVVHRDLKPGNLRLTPDGRLKILDFGLAKLLQPIAADAATESLSQTRGAVGTLPYMAPEQLQGEPPDARSDLWAAGAVLYELATGKRPFPQSSAPMLTDAILRQAPVPPRALNSNLSAELERIICKSLEKDPEHRYQSAKELGADLRRLAAPAATAATVLPAGGRKRYGWVLAAGGLVVALLVAGSVVPHWEWRDRLLGRRGASRIESLAVLPLENMSRDPDQEYFADGMTEALTTDLAHISALRVISRTSVMHYKGTGKTVPEIARELHVDAVVEGSVVKAGNRVRITAQLIEASTDRHLWAESYERDLGDVLALQDEVSRTIARKIQVTLTPQEQTRLATARPVNPEAYDAYLRGRYSLSKRSPVDIQKALAHFQQAVDKDPTYAPAYAGLADSYYLLSWYGAVSPLEVLPKGKAAATRALELDSTLAEGHLSLAQIKLIDDWDWAGAEVEYKRALELAPGSAQAHYFYGFTFLRVRARFNEAIPELKRALDLDPLSLIINTNLGTTLADARRYDEAIAQCRKTLELDSRFGQAHSVLGRAYVEKGMYQEAIREFRMALDYSPTFTGALANLGRAYALSGQKAEARKLLTELQRRSEKGFVAPGQMAWVYVGLGEKQQAIASLEKAYEVHDGLVIYVNVDPTFDSLRSEPRFQQLVRRIGLRPEDSPAAPAAAGASKASPAK